MLFLRSSRRAWPWFVVPIVAFQCGCGARGTIGEECLPDGTCIAPTLKCELRVSLLVRFACVPRER
jgi:hypothetical protein